MPRPPTFNKANSLTEELVVTARQRHRQGVSIEKMALEYGIAYETLRRAVKGLTWAWVNEADFAVQQAEDARLAQEAQDQLAAFAAANPDLIQKGD